MEKYKNESAQKVDYVTGRIITGYWIWSEAFIYNIFVERRISALGELFNRIFSRKKVTHGIWSFEDPKPFFTYVKNSFMILMFGSKRSR